MGHEALMLEEAMTLVNMHHQIRIPKKNAHTNVPRIEEETLISYREKLLVLVFNLQA